MRTSEPQSTKLLIVSLQQDFIFLRDISKSALLPAPKNLSSHSHGSPSRDPGLSHRLQVKTDTSGTQLCPPSSNSKGRAVPTTSAMAGITIRRFEEDDKETVKEIFTMGMSEHVPSSFMHLLKQPLTQMILMVTFCALLASSRSVLLPVVGVTLLLAGAKQLVGYLFNSYIDTSLRKDLDHIQETYLENKDSCFWVAESDGRVVGSVACLPAEREPGCMELKRLSVRRTHRGMGIAKALSRTVADFSRERGFPAVVLYTSVVQTDAQRLYENVGYTRVREFVIPEPIAKITNFTLIEYKLDLLQAGK
ncbi:N-acetyltransferase 8-like isoform X2 [Salvelinus fontinalis]|uniref:N-acetyltransferase 8-like isoform X2 n=1 Tax=Salvelinus fontinalis TaxID=8038 RepID=UPI0024855B75|nr:N-acetyltransferase 8-like isoform X2 [Salvelinus fontinalis]